MRNWNPDVMKGVGVTNLSQRLRGMAAGAAGTAPATRNGPRVSLDGSFRLTAGEALNIAVANPNRTLLIIQNQDVAQKLFFRFGGPANAVSGFIVPQGNVYMDVAVPQDSVWVFAIVDLSGWFYENSPSAG